MNGQSIIEILEFSIEWLNTKMQTMWSLVTTSPQDFFSSANIWSIIVGINNALIPVGSALLVLFFLAGVVKQTTSFDEMKRPEMAFKLFIRFVFAKALITLGMDIMLGIFDIVQSILFTITSNLGAVQQITLPAEIITAIQDLGFLKSIGPWLLSILCLILIIVLSMVMLLSVYTRIFKIYIYSAISPVALATFAGEGTRQTGVSFLKSYTAVCLEGAVIILGCVIYNAMASSPLPIDSTSTVSLVLSYEMGIIFNLFVLVGLVKGADVTIKTMLGL